MLGEVLSYVSYGGARAQSAEGSLPLKARRVLEDSGALDGLSRGDVALVKVHMGEKWSFRSLRPKLVRSIVDAIREAGGKPVVGDTTGVSLLSSRGTALGYLEVAWSNGFTSQVLGAPVVILDGLKGLHYVRLKAGRVLGEVEAAAGVLEADFILSVAHFKGHARTGIGGAIKNIGVGCLSKTGKARVHLARKPWVKPELCDGCGRCVEFCPAGAIELVDAKARVIDEVCLWGCGCWELCRAFSTWGEMHRSNREMTMAVAEAAKAILERFRGKIGFVNYLVDITLHCDCSPFSDIPVAHDIGVVASRDPVAADRASVDLVNSARAYSLLAEELGLSEPGVDKFSALHLYEPTADFSRHGKPSWKALLDYAEQLGLGSQAYSIAEVM